MDTKRPIHNHANGVSAPLKWTGLYIINYAALRTYIVHKPPMAVKWEYLAVLQCIHELVLLGIYEPYKLWAYKGILNAPENAPNNILPHLCGEKYPKCFIAVWRSD